MSAYLYILACNSNTAIYIGSTGSLLRRVGQHRDGVGSVHTSRYRIRKLVYFEEYESIFDARNRERLIKRWPRAWKNNLIARDNPFWRDLISDVVLRDER